MLRKTLLLSPNYEALSIINFEKTIKHLIKNKVEVISNWEDEFKIYNENVKFPAVIRLKDIKKRVQNFDYAFNRTSLLRRDGNKCQYCGIKLAKSQITIDHVIPKSRGGGNSFINCVVACKNCNTFKGNRTPEEAGMKLLKKPVHPGYVGTKFSAEADESWHTDWHFYLKR